MAQAKFQDFLAEYPLSRVIRDFSRKLTANLVSQTQQYYNASRRSGFEDHPMRHSGAALNSLLAAAVAPLTPVHMSEVPPLRTGRARPKKADKADLWCLYRDADILIDISRCGLSLDGGRRTDILRAAWTAALAPTENIDHKAYAWTGQGARISLMVIHPYSNKPAFADAWDNEERAKLVKPVEKVLGKSLSILSTWDLPNAMRVIERTPGGADGGIEFCPMIFIAGACAQVSEV